jgi:hypothetical protein
MAQRFGGDHSPGAPKNTSITRMKPQKMRGRANVLAFVALPMVFTSLNDGPVALATAILAFGLIAGGAWLTREGLEAEEAYEARTISRRPTIPRKLIGSIATGLGVALATVDGGLINGILYGAIAAGLHSFAFGLDPMKNKGVEGVDNFQTDRVARAVDEAEEHLARMLQAVETTKDRVLIARVQQFQQTARAMFRGVEQDPRDLTSVRKYLGVYLLGARDAATKFADLYLKTEDTTAKRDFTDLLDDLEANFSAKTDKLLISNKTDLDIEIGVLRDRLSREGVKVK